MRRVLELLERRLRRSRLHMTLLDPAKQTSRRAAALAAAAEAAGSDAIMIGGSTGVTQANLDATCAMIKRTVGLPLIYFPAGASALTRHVDAIYFMSVLNSRNVQHVAREQARGAPVVKALGIEPIPMGYLIIEPGMRVGEIGEADCIPRADVQSAVGYALAAEYLGMRLVYLEAGSGAPTPVPAPMIRAVRKILTVPLIVGGGIRTAQAARAVARAGADILVTGTVVEQPGGAALLPKIVEAIKATGAPRGQRSHRR